MDIPPHIQSALAIGAVAEPDELAAAVDAWSLGQEIFGLSGAEFASAAAEAAASTMSCHVGVGGRVPSGWKYLEVWQAGSLECTATLTPDFSLGVPPTAAGQSLVRAWFSEPAILVDGALPSGMLVRSSASVAGFGTFARKLTDAWAVACPLWENSGSKPSWVSGTHLAIAADARLISAPFGNVKYQELLLEAMSESKSKWRFLSVYRLLEHGYLAELLQALNAGFFLSPKESLDAASKAASSEVKQFVALGEAAALQAKFELFLDEFETLRSGGNKFAIALARSNSQAGQAAGISSKWQSGVLSYYKIRCAIVHAGTAAPIYDAYADAPDLVESLLPTAESIALSFLGVSIQ